MNPPRTTERNQTESVSGSAARRRTKVFEMKSKSIGALTHRPAHAPRGARLRDVEKSGRRDCHHEIERGPAEVEGEGPMGRAGADLAYPHELGQAGDRDQRRILERDLPEIAKSGQREAKRSE